MFLVERPSANFLSALDFKKFWFPSRSVGPEPAIIITRLGFSIAFGVSNVPSINLLIATS